MNPVLVFFREGRFEYHQDIITLFARGVDCLGLICRVGGAASRRSGITLLMTMLKQDSRPMSNASYTTGNNDLRLRNNNPRARSSVDTPPSSPNQSSRRSSRSCCFSCCGLTVRSNPEAPNTRGPSRGGNGSRGQDNSKPSLQDLELQPTADDVRLWGESFDNVMATACGRKCFRDFLRCEYSEENILFWLACEDLKKETNPEIVEEKARIIYEDYISILSPKEVSLDSRVREIINRNMVEPSRHTFDEAQLQIYTLMHRDSYPRFVNSQQYRSLVEKFLKGNNARSPAAAAAAATQQPPPNNSTGASTQSAPQSSSSNSYHRTSMS